MSAKKKFITNSIRQSSIEVSTNARMDFYHFIVSIGWWSYLAFFAAVFLLINAAFGCLYYFDESSIGGLSSKNYSEYFFFSVQTLATIGYGAKYPQSLYANILVTAEAMIGLLGLGLFAAIAFARLSIPRSRVIFSNAAVVTAYEGLPTLMFRVANERNNRIIGAEVELSLLMREVTAEGLSIRRIYDLDLIRNHSPILSLTWLVFHPIREGSPLFGMSAEKIDRSDFALIATIKGLDETISQTVHANHTYSSKDIKWHHKFKDMFLEDDSTGQSSIDLTRIHDIQAS